MGVIQGRDVTDNGIDEVRIGALAASLAATIKGIVSMCAGYLYDSAGGTWVRALGDASGRALSSIHLYDSAASAWNEALGDSSGRIIGAAHDDSTVSDRVAEVDPVDTHDVYGEPLSDTGQTDGTEWSTPVDMQHRKTHGIQIDDTPGVAGTNTYTVWASFEDVAAGSATFRDATQLYTDGSNSHNATYTTHAILVAPEGFRPRWVKVKRVRSADGGNNDGGSTIWTCVGP